MKKGSNKFTLKKKSVLFRITNKKIAFYKTCKHTQVSGAWLTSGSKKSTASSLRRPTFINVFTLLENSVYLNVPLINVRICGESPYFSRYTKLSRFG